MESQASPVQTFERGALPVLNECIAIASARGKEYADSWSLDNCVFTLTQATLARAGVALQPEVLRLVILAALCDVKDSRMSSGGPWSRDSMVDSLNYRALYATLRGEFEAAQRVSQVPQPS